MRSLVLALAVLVTGCVAFAGSAKAWCGPGCHVSLYGACVVDGWGTIRNECPVPSRPVPPCPFGLKWKHGACMPT